VAVLGRWCPFATEPYDTNGFLAESAFCGAAHRMDIADIAIRIYYELDHHRPGNFIVHSIVGIMEIFGQEAVPAFGAAGIFCFNLNPGESDESGSVLGVGLHDG